MKVLVTGNLGYIGSVLVPILKKEGHEVVGYDIGYYKDCLLYDDHTHIKQIVKDIRDVSIEDLTGIEAVIHLAALSNDPLGELSPGLTEEINLMGTLKIAELAQKAGVKRFIYSSSQSMYGISTFEGELDEYNSPRLRCDIVFNNLVACAYTTGKIEIKSDGTPNRPVVHVKDVCAAYLAGLNAPAELVAGRAFNVGIPNGNFTVRQLAEAAQRAVPGSELTFTGEHGNDARTYRVSFNRILTELKDYFKPEWDLDKGGKELVDLFNKVNFKEEEFRGKKTTRLAQLSYLQKNNIIDIKMRY